MSWKEGVGVGRNKKMPWEKKKTSGLVPEGKTRWDDGTVPSRTIKPNKILEVSGHFVARGGTFWEADPGGKTLKKHRYQSGRTKNLKKTAVGKNTFLKRLVGKKKTTQGKNGYGSVREMGLEKKT